MDKVLITAVSGDVGSSTARALKNLGYYVIGVDINHMCPVMDYLDAFESLPPAISNTYTESLISLSKKYAIDAVIPCSEVEIRRINLDKGSFIKNKVALLINDSKILDIFFDKLSTIEYLRALNIPVPKTLPLSDYDNNFRLPALVKPRQGCGSLSIYHVGDKEIVYYLKKKYNSEMILQEEIGSASEEYTTGIFSDGKNIFSITFQRVLAKGGYSNQVRLIHDSKIARLSKLIAKAVKLEGCINLQTRRVGENFIPFEINPRISSTVMFRALAGFNDVHWWLDWILHQKSPVYMPMATFSGIRYLSEKVFICREY